MVTGSNPEDKKNVGLFLMLFRRVLFVIKALSALFPLRKKKKIYILSFFLSFFLSFYLSFFLPFFVVVFVVVV